MADGKIRTESQGNRAKGIIHLFGFAALVLGFIMFFAPFLDRAPFVQPLIHFIDERDIDATALFYTEIEEFSDAANYMNNAMVFSPQEWFEIENR